jgi:hypothetical protein
MARFVGGVAMRGSKTGGVVAVVAPGASAGSVAGVGAGAVAGVVVLGATAGAGVVAPPTPLAFPDGVALVAAPALPPDGPAGPAACPSARPAESVTSAAANASRPQAFFIAVLLRGLDGSKDSARQLAAVMSELQRAGL